MARLHTKMSHHVVYTGTSHFVFRQNRVTILQLL